MIHVVLHLYLMLFARCELMVSFLDDFSHCNDSPAWAAHCYATSDWDYGGAPLATLRRADAALEMFIGHLPLVRTVSCWEEAR